MGGAFSSSGSGSSNVPHKKSPPPGAGVTATDRATLDLKNARDKLQKYKKKLESDEVRIVERAKKAKADGNTKVALNLLKVRKMKNREVESAEAQLLNILQMTQTIESKENEVKVLAAMKQGKDTLKRMHEETTIDDVLNLMDEIQEQNELENEMNKILGDEGISVDDEAEVLAELEALVEQEQTVPVEQDQLPVAPNAQPLPEAPSTKLPETQATSTQQEKVAVAS